MELNTITRRHLLRQMPNLWHTQRHVANHGNDDYVSCRRYKGGNYDLIVIYV